MADWKKNTVHTLDITGYTAEGMGVARLEGRVVFVPHTIRGERWQVRLEKGQYLYRDLYGFSVYDQRSGQTIGTLREVLERPASMVYVIDCGGAEVLVPAVPPFHQGVDLEGRVLTIRTIEGMLPHEN